MDFISIIIPIYNNERYLKESLNSVINLNYKNIEIIIIDDGSTDCSAQIIKKYIEKDQRIIFFQNSRNIGTAKTIKKGIQHSKGKYILFNAADDISLPYRVEKCIDIFMNNKSVGLIASTATIIDTNGIETGKCFDLNEKVQNNNIAIEQFKRNYCLGATMAIINDKEVLLKDGMLEYMDDYEISLEYLLNDYEIYLTREPLIKYRIHEDNQSNNRHILSDKTKLVLRKYNNDEIFDNLKTRGYAQKEIYVTLGILNLFKEDIENATRYLEQADDLINCVSNAKLEFENKFYLGVVNYRLENIKESEKNFQLAHCIDKNEPSVLNNLGALYACLNNNSIKAIQMFEAALNIYPDYIDAKNNMQKVVGSDYNNLRITERILDVQFYKRSQYTV